MKVNKNWAIKYAYPVFFIGLFTAMGDFLIGKFAYIGFGIMLFSFYLMYLSRDKKYLKHLKLYMIVNVRFVELD